MAKYGNFLYGSAKYGIAPQLAYSVEPMSIVIIDFTRSLLSWSSPTGDFSRIRLVRNQIGFPETAEDGVIIWEEYATEGNVTRSSFADGEDNPNDIPLIPGKPVYYGMFLFTDQKVWVNAGKISDVIPLNHGMQKRIMDIIPKVYTSKEQSPLGVTDQDSDLYNFIDGFAFTLEQIMTLIDLVRPNHTKEGSPSSLIPIQVDNVGLNQEQSIPIKNQKQLIREAFYMYSYKGVKSGLETYVESLTGYAPSISVSSNLLLTVQDSTFYNSLGNWVFENCTATVSSEQVPASGDNVIDEIYSCKIIATDGFSMLLGSNDTITKAIPVTAGEEYIASCKIKSPASAGSVSIVIGWYDGSGTFISASSDTLVAANNTWKSVSTTEVAPSNAVYAGLQISSNDSGTYYVDQVCMQLGDTIVYDEARAINVELLPSKTNWIKNPSFEVNVTDNWTIDGATVAQDVDISDLAYSGENSAKITATGPWTFTSNLIPITVGRYYTASGLIKTTDNIQVNFIGRDSEGTILEDADIFTLDASAEWSKFTATDLTDSTLTDIVTYEIVFSGDSGTYYLDCLQFQEGSVATEYFDGSLPSEFGVVWAGAVDNSYSYEYPNKLFKIPRLAYTIEDWIPPNAFWRISTLAGLEYTNLTV